VTAVLTVYHDFISRRSRQMTDFREIECENGKGMALDYDFL
jgi:hypothetical protein